MRSAKKQLYYEIEYFLSLDLLQSSGGLFQTLFFIFMILIYIPKLLESTKILGNILYKFVDDSYKDTIDNNLYSEDDEDDDEQTKTNKDINRF